MHATFIHHRLAKFRTSVLLLVATLLVPGMYASRAVAQEDQLPPTDAMAWVLGTKLGIAAVGLEAGAEQKTVDSMMQTAELIAGALGAEVPKLPEKGQKKRAEFGAEILRYLLNDVEPVAKHLIQQHGQRTGDLFEIGVKSSVLGIMYAPNDETGLAIADVIEDRAKRASLDEKLWKPLVQDIRNGASYDEVKKKLFEMHAAVRDALMQDVAQTP